MSEWRFMAYRPNGRGSESLIHPDLPMADVEVTRVLSGPDEFRATVSPRFASLIGEDGLPVFVPWATTIYAECDGVIRSGCIVTDTEQVDQATLNIDGVGFSGYLQDLPFTGQFTAYEVDPMDMARWIWTHAQSGTNGNIGLIIDTADTGGKRKIGIRGKEAFRGRPVIKDAQGNVVLPAAPATPAIQDEPFTLSWYETQDLSREFNDLATVTPFDYAEHHYWDGDRIEHFLEMSYPKRGARKPLLRFVVGENVMRAPTIKMPGVLFASDVMVLGAGEGNKTLKSYEVDHSQGRLRRVSTLIDKGIGRMDTARNLARSRLSKLQGGLDIDELIVQNGPGAPFGSYDVGDEILVQGTEGWYGDAQAWLRVIEMTMRPGSDDSVSLTVEREGVGQ